MNLDEDPACSVVGLFVVAGIVLPLPARDDGADPVAVGSARGDEGGDYDDASVHEQPRDLPDPPDVLPAIVGTES